MTDRTSLEDFYKETGSVIPSDISKEIGHFNVFNITQVMKKSRKDKSYMPYNRREYYKISLIKGRNRAEYADKVIDIKKNALLFATPKVPYHYIPKDQDQSGYFCIFTDDFIKKDKSGMVIDHLPIFKPNGYPVFELTEEQAADIEAIFMKMYEEISSDYIYKYDLLRNYVLELIHRGQKMQPAEASYNTSNASSRITSLFIELLERQFPIESPHQRIEIKTAGEYAERLAVHVNHLNKVLKENTAKTTTQLINGRILKEAKILLKQTDWSISEIAYSLGYEEIAHFSNFFKKQTTLTPLKFRS